jgi:MFS family permease
MDSVSDNLQRIVRRNTILLSTGQAALTISTQITAIIGALATFQLSGDPSLSGLVFSLTWGGRILVSYASGFFMDRMGRKPILLIGGVLTMLTSVILGLSVLTKSLFGMLAVFFIYGIGTAILNQNRVAVTDMYSESKMGTAVGYLYTSSIIGALLAIPFVAIVEPLSQGLGINEYALLWIAGAAILLATIVTTIMIKPDTKEIANVVRSIKTVKQERNSLPKSAGILISFIVSALSSGIMVAMMSLLSLHMNQHNVPVTLITVAVTIHIIGMFAFSLPFGRVVDKIGAKNVMILGSVVTGVGGLITPLSTNYFIEMFGIFLVGIGWSAATVSTTALISSLAAPSVRGRTLGLNDMLIGFASISAPFAGGVVIGAYGFLAFGLYGFLLSVPAIIAAALLKTTRLSALS